MATDVAALQRKRQEMTELLEEAKAKNSERLIQKYSNLVKKCDAEISAARGESAPSARPSITNVEDDMPRTHSLDKVFSPTDPVVSSNGNSHTGTRGGTSPDAAVASAWGTTAVTDTGSSNLFDIWNSTPDEILHTKAKSKKSTEAPEDTVVPTYYEEAAAALVDETPSAEAPKKTSKLSASAAPYQPAFIPSLGPDFPFPGLPGQPPVFGPGAKKQKAAKNASDDDGSDSVDADNTKHKRRRTRQRDKKKQSEASEASSATVKTSVPAPKVEERRTPQPKAEEHQSTPQPNVDPAIVMAVPSRKDHREPVKTPPRDHHYDDSSSSSDSDSGSGANEQGKKKAPQAKPEKPGKFKDPSIPIPSWKISSTERERKPRAEGSAKRPGVGQGTPDDFESHIPSNATPAIRDAIKLMEKNFPFADEFKLHWVPARHSYRVQRRSAKQKITQEQRDAVIKLNEVRCALERVPWDAVIGEIENDSLFMFFPQIQWSDEENGYIVNQAEKSRPLEQRDVVYIEHTIKHISLKRRLYLALKEQGSWTPQGLSKYQRDISATLADDPENAELQQLLNILKYFRLAFLPTASTHRKDGPPGREKDKSKESNDKEKEKKESSQPSQASGDAAEEPKKSKRRERAERKSNEASTK